MYESLRSFEAELSKLHSFLDASDAEDELVTQLLTGRRSDNDGLGRFLETIRTNSTTKRRQNYVSSIIVLYGALERYVEEAIAEYTQNVVDIHGKYSLLPNKLKESHTKLTIEYLALLKEGRVRETDDISTLVETLNDCLNGNVRFQLNARAFSLRSSNMNLTRIREIAGNLNIQLSDRRIVCAPTYHQYLVESDNVSPKEMKVGEIQSTIDHVDDLVRFRNDIAHGVANLENIEENDIVRERATKLRAFVGSLNEIFECELLEARLRLNQLTKVEGEVLVYGENIVCFPWACGKIRPGDLLVMRPAEEGADLRKGGIESIQINHEEQSEVRGREGLMIGVRVPFKAKQNGTFFVFCQDSSR